jgi:hypothetical protein
MFACRFLLVYKIMFLLDRTANWEWEKNYNREHETMLYLLRWIQNSRLETGKFMMHEINFRQT